MRGELKVTGTLFLLGSRVVGLLRKSRGNLRTQKQAGPTRNTGLDADAQVPGPGSPERCMIEHHTCPCVHKGITGVGDLLKTSTGAEGKWFRFLFAGVGGGTAGAG